MPEAGGMRDLKGEMTAKDILIKRLQDNGYDGLYGGERCEAWRKQGEETITPDLTGEEREKLSIFLNEEYFPNSIRTFTTAQDMMDLNDKLIEKEKWYAFFDFARDEFMDSTMGYADYFSFLINPSLFCWLVKEFLKK